jgi:arylsulfatase A-like enzyme
MKRPRIKRAILAAVFIAALLALANHIMSFPMAFRAGDWRAWLGQGPAGTPLVRAYRLLDLTPTSREVPHDKEAAEALGDKVLTTNSPYAESATLGVHRYWESNRPVLLAPAPAAISYRLTVPARSKLTFGYTAKWMRKNQLQNGARFIVEWTGPEGTRRLFEQEIKPERPGFWEKNDGRERIWFRYAHARFGRRGDLYRDAEVSLDALAGQTGELKFITELGAKNCAAAYALSMWSNPEVWAERPASEPPPVNVLLLMIEATPTTIVEPYVSSPAVTPNLKKFAEGAHIFDRFFTVGDSTQLSTFSFFTGRHYRAMGLPNEMYYLAPLVKARFYRNRLATMSEAFSRAGYKTVEFGTNHYFNPTREFGLDLGFDELEILGRRTYEHVDTTLAAMEWLRRNGDKPFFLYIHYNAPHEEEKPCLEDLWTAATVRGADWRWIYRKNLAQEHRADQDFGKFLSALDTLGLRGRTLIVVTADHGNCTIAEHNFAVIKPDGDRWETPFQHSRAMSAEDMNPPLMIGGPLIARPGTRDHTPLASIDLFPTLAQLLIKDQPEDLQTRMADLDGQSFAGLLTGDPAQPRGGHPAIYSISEGGENLIADGRYHYFRRSPAFQRLLYPGARELKVVIDGVFDLDSDPREVTDLAATEPELLARLRKALDQNRPPEPRMRFLYFNLERGRVQARLGLGASGGVSQAITFPEDRKPITLTPAADAGNTFEFETELSGPTGLILEDPVEWASVAAGATPLPPSAWRIGPFGLPLLAHGPCAAGPVMLEGCTQLPASLLVASRHPTHYMSAPGVYFYEMSFSDFVAETFSNEELSPEVKALLKQWGYIR